MRNIFKTLLFFILAVGFGQNNDATKRDSILIKEKKTKIAQDSTQTSYNLIFTSVDISAIPPGGMNEFRKYVGQSFRLPEVNNSTIGKVITKFTVCNDGSICDIQVINESPADLGLGEEVKRILNQSGNWKPAQKNETLNIVKIIDLAIDIFTEPYVKFVSKEEEIIAKFDRTQLIRVITNLVKNAIQAIKHVENPTVLIDVYSTQEDVIITVTDNGCGISEENKEKVFEPKFTTKTSGMGLGLAMIKNIIEAYDGAISFTSKEGVGTVFSVILPKT